MTSTPLEHVRQLCLQFPDATERLSHGAPAFFTRNKKAFAMFMDNHHQDGRLALWCAAPWGAQDALVQSRPDAFFVPPYVGHRGWVGVRLDQDVPWQDIADVIEDAYRTVAPKPRLARVK